MSRTIDQFMWGYQPHFRIELEVLAKQVLETADVKVEPRAILVGFAQAGTSVRHDICVEPESGSVQPSHLSGALDRAEEIFDGDPEREIFHSDPKVRRIRTNWLVRRSRARALEEAIATSGVFAGSTVRAGTGWDVGDYHVHPCIVIDEAVFKGIPKLVGEDVNRWPAPSSFLGRCVDLVLAEAGAALQLPAPGEGDSIRRSFRDILHSAASAFCDGVMYRTGNYDLSHLFEALNSISAQTYEGGRSRGRLLLVAPEHDLATVHTWFRRRIALDSHRAVRKLLETTDRDSALLVHTGGVYGMGSVVPGNDQDAFEVELVAHATWELRRQEEALLRVTYGKPAVPRPVLDVHLIVDSLERVLGSDADVRALLELARGASLARTGSTLVISKGAPTEADRLAGQATPIDPIPLTPELLERYMKVDGAVLVDSRGVCHAFGVILDGPTGRGGDPARGSRYNSAVRYQAADDRAPTVVFVTSEDGDISIVPTPRPRIRRQVVLDALTSLAEAFASPEEPARFAEAFEHVRRLGFYLSPDQCDWVNELADEEEKRRMETSQMSVLWPDLAPHPDLDDSFFLD